ATIVIFVCIAANPCILALGPCRIARLIAEFTSFAFAYLGSFHFPYGILHSFCLASGNLLFRILSPIHTKPYLRANDCDSLINASILRYLSKKLNRNSSASSTLIPNDCDNPYLLAPYIDESRTIFICFRSSVSDPSGNL